MTLGVLFVCTGNICRSPTAEGVLRQRLREAGLEGQITSASAGIAGYHVGEPPDPRSTEAAARRGYSLEGQRARRVTVEDFATQDLILAMDRGHLAALDRLRPADGRAQVMLFMDFAPGFGADEVPDPYYGDVGDFETVLNQIETGVDGLMRHLRLELAKITG